jgi:hypothetical protein
MDDKKKIWICGKKKGKKRWKLKEIMGKLKM